MAKYHYSYYLPGIRTCNLLIFLFCFGLMSVGLIMQTIMGLEPCPLCMTQRLFICLTGALALLAVLHRPKAGGHKFYAVFTAISALLGGGFSSRQLWLQSLPEDLVPACGPSFSYMFETFPFMDAMKIMLTGDGNCAEVVWTFLGISIPGWTLVAFSCLAATSLWQFLRPSSH